MPSISISNRKRGYKLKKLSEIDQYLFEKTVALANTMVFRVYVEEFHSFEAVLWGYDEFGPLLSNRLWIYKRTHTLVFREEGSQSLQLRQNAKWHVAFTTDQNRLFFFKKENDAVLFKLRFG